MGRSSRILYTLLSILPLVLFVVYIGVFAFTLADILRNIEELENDPDPTFILSEFGTMIVFGIIMALVSLATLIVFIIHAINNKSIPDNERIIWVLVFVFAGLIGFPIYWFMRGINYDPNAPLPPG